MQGLIHLLTPIFSFRFRSVNFGAYGCTLNCSHSGPVLGPSLVHSSALDCISNLLHCPWQAFPLGKLDTRRSAFIHFISVRLTACRIRFTALGRLSLWASKIPSPAHYLAPVSKVQSVPFAAPARLPKILKAGLKF